jgi:hypothetical protein
MEESKEREKERGVQQFFAGSSCRAEMLRVYMCVIIRRKEEEEEEEKRGIVNKPPPPSTPALLKSQHTAI